MEIFWVLAPGVNWARSEARFMKLDLVSQNRILKLKAKCYFISDTNFFEFCLLKKQMAHQRRLVWPIYSSIVHIPYEQFNNL